jgi:hypothetical protein
VVTARRLRACVRTIALFVPALGAGCSLLFPYDDYRGSDGDADRDGGGSSGDVVSVDGELDALGDAGDSGPKPRCDGSDCEPDLVLSNMPTPRALLVTNDAIWWTSILGLHTCAKNTTCNTDVASAKAGFAIAADAQYIYWTLDSTREVARCPRANCTLASTVILVDDGGVNGVAVANALGGPATFYIDARGTLNMIDPTFNGSVLAAKDTADSVGHLKGVGSTLLWYALTPWTGIRRCSTSTSCNTSLGTVTNTPAAGGGTFYELAIDPTTMLWRVDQNTGPSSDVFSCPLTGSCTPTLVYREQAVGKVTAIALDGTDTYLAATGGLYRCSTTAGCSASKETLVPRAANIQIKPIALDADRIYWIEFGGGTFSLHRRKK